MRILVTGGAGFIGTHLVKMLLEHEQHTILVIDINPSSTQNNHDNLSYAQCDITNESLVDDLFDSFKPEVIIHLAALHFIPECNKNPNKVAKTNAAGTANLIFVSNKYNIENFIFASSAAVYAPRYLWPHKTLWGKVISKIF